MARISHWVLVILIGGLSLQGMAETVGSQAPPNYLSFATEDERNNIEIFKSASPSVVWITNTAFRRAPFSRNVQAIPQGTGSGFIWNNQGYVVTNFHVIKGADKLTVTLADQSAWQAKVVGIAPDKDLAVLLIDAPQALLKPLPVGDSQQLEVGRKVLAIGNPFGLDTTLTVGVISALGREIESPTQRKIQDVIQTDAAINPGNSGGPLLNSLGQLVGVNTAIYSPSGASAGIGFAIPVNAVKKTIPQLIQFGRVVRPIIGIEQAPDRWAQRYGIKGIAVVRSQRGLPAAKAGIIGMNRDRRGKIVLGDIIIGIDGAAVLNSDDLLTILEGHKAGDRITVTTQREGDIRNYELVLAPAS